MTAALESLETPQLVLDRAVLRANLARMGNRIAGLGCRLRPHTKTHKSLNVFEELRAVSAHHGVTVSTLSEARLFCDAGERDILYAVGLVPSKMARVAGLMRDGCALTAITDSVDMARLLDEAARAHAIVLPILVELDVDGHRSGVDPDGEALIAVARAIDGADGLALRGVMTHAGGSYGSGDRAALQRHAAGEVTRAVHAADRLRAAGLPCPVVSIGSTPTASVVEDLTGVTEIRPGVYTFHDLFQAGLGVAALSDIAISVLSTVIGHQADKGWVIVDAGWMALSRDRSTAGQAVDQGYGLVCDAGGAPLEDVIVASTNQEHGVITARAGAAPLDLARFPVGSVVRVLPNHACATAAQHDAYWVLEDGAVTARWPRIHGW